MEGVFDCARRSAAAAVADTIDNGVSPQYMYAIDAFTLPEILCASRVHVHQPQQESSYKIWNECPVGGQLPRMKKRKMEAIQNEIREIRGVESAIAASRTVEKQRRLCLAMPVRRY